MNQTILLKEVIYDKRARDGTWCKLPYPPNHKKGCKNFPMCIEKRPDFNDLDFKLWYAVIQTYDLHSHAMRMHKKHGWESRWMQRNRYHWQNQVVSKLLKESWTLSDTKLTETIILDIPEACGVNVYATMAKHGIYLKSDPDLVYKIMMVGVK